MNYSPQKHLNKFGTFLVACSLIASMALMPAKALASSEISNGMLRVEVTGTGAASVETISLKQGGAWVPVLSAPASVLRVTGTDGMKVCQFERAEQIERGLLIFGNCGPAGGYDQRIVFTAEKDVLQVTTRLRLPPQATVHAIEDRYDFLPAKHPVSVPLDSPLDFVWSQDIKKEADDVVASQQFKSPVIMFQQGEVFAAVTPILRDRIAEPLALDMNVTSDAHPWLGYGAIPSVPSGHSYYRRVNDQSPHNIANKMIYTYTLTVSKQPPMLGYRRVVHDLWTEYGHPELLDSPDMQQNAVDPELASFNQWRTEAWHTYADRVYTGFDCGGSKCGTLSSNRTFAGSGAAGQPDAWFNPWFQDLRSAYGWFTYGEKTHDAAIMTKAESVLNLALSAPQKQGAFPSIYYVKDNKWFNDDGWAGYKEDYSSFSMSWTAYWMLKWATDLEPSRKKEVMKYVTAYGDFLLKHQLKSGVIPSWYDESFTPRTEFRDFNGETGVSALLLAELGSETKDARYTEAAERAMQFVTDQVIPRQKWFDFETFLSCARKPYDFYDTWTAQFPQNNLAEIQTVQAWLTLYQTTHKPIYLERGTNALDYLLLTQQVWNNPLYTPKLLGGFTTQNTDSEWSDARQGYVAPLLLDYFQATGNFEYLERAVAAARSTFAVAPWENWAHNGHPDGPGAMTGFHWGTGSAMTSVEIMQPLLGDAYIDAKAGKGVGFDECTVRDVAVKGDSISFQLESKDLQRPFHVHFANLDPKQHYLVSWNGGEAVKVAATDLLANGVTVQPLGPQ
jgi:hypothetical protein